MALGTFVDLRVGTTITQVDNYSSLPLPTSVPAKYYWVSNSQGVKWIGALWGGNYYPRGLYYSNGVSWEYLETPIQATQAEVDAGLVTDKFVTPETLDRASKWATKEDVSNKTNTIVGNETSVSLYASVKGVVDWVSSLFVPKTRTITINGTSQDLSADRSWTISGSGSAFTMYELAADVTSTLDTLADVPGWSFSVTAGKSYRIEIIAGFQTAATTTGGNMGARTSAANTGVIRGMMQADITQATAASGLKKVIYDIADTYVFTARMASTGVSVQNAEHSWNAIMAFKCNNSGTFYVGWSSEVAGSAATLKQYSVLLVTEI